MPVKSAVRERRRFLRALQPTHVNVNLLEPRTTSPVTHVNHSEGGLCLRLEEPLEVRSLVRLQVSAEGAEEHSDRAPEITGRVAWVVQRLDLRNAPPFLFDVGIEFTRPSRLHALTVTQTAAVLARSPRNRVRALDATTIAGRVFMPGLEREAAARWHLVISVEGVPCFSGRYATEREALTAWAAFQRQQARRRHG
jgi:hypothetical protein